MRGRLLITGVGLLLATTVGLGPTTGAGAEQAAPATARRPHFGIGQRELSLVDTSRPTMADPARHLAAKPDRTLDTLVLYPTRVDENGPPHADAHAAKGHFPLIVFSHGLTARGDLYAPFLQDMVRHGYVVALPTFPLTSGHGADAADYVNQPGDVSFVIDELVQLSRDKHTWLSGRLRTHDIGVAGHSLGGLTSLALVRNQCCLDSRVKAAAVLAGGTLPFPGGSWDDPPDTPLLLVHGLADKSVPISASDAVFAASTGPTAFLRLDNADHVGMFFDHDGLLTLRALMAFFDAHLGHHRKGLLTMPLVVALAGHAEWRTAP